MRRLTALCAAAGIALSTFVVVSPAQAAPWHLIRWDNTGVCQVIDDNFPIKPLKWPSDYKVMSHPMPTFAATQGVKEVLLKQGKCRF